MDRRLSILLATLLAASALAAGCDLKTQAAPAPAGPQAVPVKLAPVRAATISEASEYVATLRSRRSITLQPQVEGYVSRILVRSGQVVKAGQPLMQIDAARQAASVRSQEATRVAREAQLAYAKQQYERLSALAAQGVVAQAQVDQARATLDAAQADANSLEAQVRQQRVQLQYFRITAPAEGVVGDIPVREGDYVTPSTRLTTVDQNQSLELYVSVPVERAVGVKPGMRVEVLDRDGKKLADSRIFFVSPQVNDETQSVLIKARIDNASGDLRADQFVRARVVFGTREGPVVPATAVTRMNGQPFAFVAKDEKGSLVARQRPIELGDLVGNDYVVLKGLEPGERVVVSGVQKLMDGAPVAPES